MVGVVPVFYFMFLIISNLKKLFDPIYTSEIVF